MRAALRLVLTQVVNAASGIVLVSGAGQTARVNTAFASALTVKVINGSGAPVAQCDSLLVRADRGCVGGAQRT